jgi:hypothetical protein
MNEPTKPKPSKAVSRYFRELAYRSAAKIRGTEAARLRGEKMRAAKARKAAERKAARALQVQEM